ncbi:MAG TPA: hypothetical protein VJC39_01495 [Candidatus Nanoarchaeia archaeon]|nr:hypothetical protein [Candidatus Nanoarchaeia archaeon]
MTYAAYFKNKEDAVCIYNALVRMCRARDRSNLPGVKIKRLELRVEDEILLSNLEEIAKGFRFRYTVRKE